MGEHYYELWYHNGKEWIMHMQGKYFDKSLVEEDAKLLMGLPGFYKIRILKFIAQQIFDSEVDLFL